jgi:uncharacterized protein
MTDTSLAPSGPLSLLAAIWRDQRVWLVSALILGALAVFDPGQAADSAAFAGERSCGRRPS